MLSTEWIIPLIRGPRGRIARVRGEQVRSAAGDETAALSLPAGSNVRVHEAAVPGAFGGHRTSSRQYSRPRPRPPDPGQADTPPVHSPGGASHAGTPTVRRATVQASGLPPSRLTLDGAAG